MRVLWRFRNRGFAVSGPNWRPWLEKMRSSEGEGETLRVRGKLAEEAKSHMRPVAEVSYWLGYTNGLAAAASLIQHEDVPESGES